MRKINQKTSIFAFIMLILSLFSFYFTFTNSTYANAETSTYTSVLSDLQKDETFDVKNYPAINGNYSLQVIQVAESNAKELFVYVYQPSSYISDLRATSINISTGINENVKYINYTLDFIDSYNTLYKYKVNNFRIKNDALRYYDITSIYRKWSSALDQETGNDNTINDVSFTVGKLFTASTVQGVVSYSCIENETIVVTNKYVGHVRYLNGFWLYQDSCDSHFVAFSTDKPIDKLMEADLTYIAEVGSGSLATGSWTADNTETITKTIHADDTASSDMTGPFGHTYTWNRIESSTEFIENEDLISEAKNNLKEMQWVLRFAETDYMEYNGMYNPHYDATRISEVTILRLKFETNGLVYNLGVVDNKQTGDLLPENVKRGINWLLLSFIILLIVIFLLVVFAPSILLSIIKAIFNAIWYVLKGIWWVLTSPLKIFEKEEEK